MSEAATGQSITMVWRLIDHILVTVHAETAPSESEFDAYIEFARSKLPPSCRHCMVVAPGGAGPNAKQRERVNAVLKLRKFPMKVAVVTDSTMVRGVVTALAWFNEGRTKAFPSEKMDEALTYLDVASAEKSGKIALEVRMMQKSLGGRVR